MIIFRTFKSWQSHGKYLYEFSENSPFFKTYREDGHAEYSRFQKFRYFTMRTGGQTTLDEVCEYNMSYYANSRNLNDCI